MKTEDALVERVSREIRWANYATRNRDAGTGLVVRARARAMAEEALEGTLSEWSRYILTGRLEQMARPEEDDWG